MNLVAFARMILRRGWLVVLMTVLGVGAGLALAATQSPRYEALTRVAVEPARQADYGQAQAAKEIMRSFMQDIHTHDMAEATAARLGDAWLAEHDLDAEALYWAVSVTGDEDVYDIHIKARADDPRTAVDISETWALAYVDRREEAIRELDLRDRIGVKVRDTTSWSQVRPRRKLLAAAGAVLGLAAGGLLMLVLEHVERAVVRHRRDAEVIAGAPVLGILPPTAGGAVGAMGALRHGGRDLRRFTAGALRRGWPVLTMALIGALAAWAATRQMPEIHRARTRIAVEPARANDWGNTQAVPQTMRSFAEDITTRRMASEVNDRLQLDLPPERLLERILVAPQEAIYEIHLDAHHPDPEIAVAISRTWADVFIRQHRLDEQVLDQPDRILVRRRDQTRPDPRLYSPRTGAAMAAGAVAGAILGAAAVALLGLARRMVITDPAAARAAAGTDAPLLGVIPPAAPRAAGSRGRRASAPKNEGATA